LRPPRGSAVVKALCYKPEGCGLETRWGERISFNLPSGRTRPWGFTQPLTDRSTRKRQIMFLGSKSRPVRGADNLMSRLSRQCAMLNISQA
jgi:hypothetical protein